MNKYLRRRFWMLLDIPVNWLSGDRMPRPVRRQALRAKWRIRFRIGKLENGIYEDENDIDYFTPV